MQIRKQFKFEAAHVLPHHAGKCARLHGHSYRLDVTIEGPLHASGPATGMIADFDVISRAVRTHVIDVLDHTSLNDVLDNPTSEEIVLWAWRRLAPHLSQLAELVLWETATACAILRADDAELT